MRYMISTKRTRIAVAVALLGASLLAAYVKIIRPWQLRWGATTAEVQQPMPGDDLIPDASLIATRAITIYAPAAAVWPWLVQMGYRRAGWYSYDWFDNDGIHVDRILPEFQHLKVGDTLLTDPAGGFRVEAIEPEQSLVLMIHSDEARRGSEISSAIVLNPLDKRHTRLILRVRARFTGMRGRLFGLLFDFGDFVMMRKTLLGIKHRAQVMVEHQLPF